MATKNQTAKQVAKRNNINIGDKITFIVSDAYGSEVITEKVSRINEKSITATHFARSGFDFQQSYRVKVENILSVTDAKGKTRKVK